MILCHYKTKINLYQYCNSYYGNPKIQVKADLIPIELEQLKLKRPNYPDNCLILDIADNVKDKVVIKVMIF